MTEDQARQRRAIRRNAIILGVVALCFYGAYIMVVASAG